jgi:hypothetical protein
MTFGISLFRKLMKVRAFGGIGACALLVDAADNADAVAEVEA